MPLGGIATAAMSIGDISALTGMITGGLGSLGKSIFGIGQMNKAKQINPQWNDVKENPLAYQNLGAVKNLYYGKSPAYLQAAANIRQLQSNTMANAQRNAPDSATLLATGAGTEAQTQANITGLAGKEFQDTAGILDNLSRAYGMAINEGDKVNANKLMKYQLDSQAQADLRKSGATNIFGGISDLAGGAIQYGNYMNTRDQNKDINNWLKTRK
jgi:hypothetical protein